MIIDKSKRKMEMKDLRELKIYQFCNPFLRARLAAILSVEHIGGDKVIDFLKSFETAQDANVTQFESEQSNVITISYIENLSGSLNIREGSYLVNCNIISSKNDRSFTIFKSVMPTNCEYPNNDMQTEQLIISDMEGGKCYFRTRSGRAAAMSYDASQFRELDNQNSSKLEEEIGERWESELGE